MAKQIATSRTTRDRRRKRDVKKSSPGGKGAIFFGIIAIAVLTAAGYFLLPVLRAGEPGTPGAITIQTSMGGFSVSKIETKVGEPITLRLVNMDDRFHTDGGGWHQFAIDELRVDFKVPPEKTQEFTFTPTKAGTFQFYCDVCCGGRENPYMVGTVVVIS